MGQLVTQLKITTKDHVGGLARLTEAIKASGVNISAACAWVQDGAGNLCLIADNGGKAASALNGMVDSCQTQQVVSVQVPNKMGALNDVAAKLAKAGIGIKFCYATAAAGPTAMLVFDTVDNAKAATLI